MINWKVRIRNKTFWLTFLPAVLLLVKEVLGIFGIEFDSTELSSQLTDVVVSVFALLALLGVINDPTTAGTTDSEQAMSYTEPKQDGDANG